MYECIIVHIVQAKKEGTEYNKKSESFENTLVYL